ncbi:MAG: IPT/TIG domain-containing protein, partial [Thermoplasmata archaeon]|nr:IPT/TIG domain-containing protein [Thermoplasmata archaeon]
MAVPTITSVSPVVGPTGGGNLVEVRGANFKLWVIPPPTSGPLPPPTPTVRVSFDGVPGSGVLVASATRLFVRAPKSPLAPVKPDYGEGSVDVEVANLQPSGAPVVGEVMTAVDAYAYQRVNLAIESDLLRFVRTIIRELRLQVHPNVSLTTHTDWDENPDDGKN